MSMQESGENYLETIYVLHRKNGFVRSIDIANELDYAKASISRAMSILKSQDYITMEPNGQILLTEKGEQKANKIYERHQYITNYLMATLGLPQEIADKDACRIEHVISQETFDEIKQFCQSSK